MIRQQSSDNVAAFVPVVAIVKEVVASKLSSTHFENRNEAAARRKKCEALAIIAVLPLMNDALSVENLRKTIRQCCVDLIKRGELASSKLGDVETVNAKHQNVMRAAALGMFDARYPMAKIAEEFKSVIARDKSNFTKANRLIDLECDIPKDGGFDAIRKAFERYYYYAHF